MLSNPPFYFSLFRKYVSIFGTLFNNIAVVRFDSAGEVEKVIKVPITYAPKDKMLTRVFEEPVLQQGGRETAVTLPLMSFECTGLFYTGSDGKLTTTGKVVKKDEDANELKYQFNPVSYDLTWDLNIYVKNAEDGTKIIEQIIPFFTPAVTTHVDLIPEMGISRNIPVILDQIIPDDSYAGDMLERRRIVWTLRFTMKAYFYGPVRTNPVIKFANVSFYIPNTEDIRDGVGNSAPVARITTQPGLLANGSPTTNSAASIPYSQIEVDDDFGYCVDQFDPILDEEL